MQAWLHSLWRDTKERSWPRPTTRSDLRAGSTPAGRALGARCATTRAAGEGRRLGRATRRLRGRQYGREVADLIATTVARWDGAEAARRIELQVGRDLQFIRINGTVVGGLAGLVIYSVGQLL